MSMLSDIITIRKKAKMITTTTSQGVKKFHIALLPDGSKEYFSSSVIYQWGTSYQDIWGKWHLSTKSKTEGAAIQSAKKQNRSPVWADKPVQVIRIKV